jgi:hypothetical protein
VTFEAWLADVAERLGIEPEDVLETGDVKGLLYEARVSPAEAASLIGSTAW